MTAGGLEARQLSNKAPPAGSLLMQLELYLPRGWVDVLVQGVQPFDTVT